MNSTAGDRFPRRAALPRHPQAKAQYGGRIVRGNSLCELIPERSVIVARSLSRINGQDFPQGVLVPVILDLRRP